jgi:hypothetical protein
MATTLIGGPALQFHLYEDRSSTGLSIFAIVGYAHADSLEARTGRH